MKLKIAVLIPRSDMYPALGMDFLNGTKLSVPELESLGVSPEYIVEGIGNAATDDVIKTAEKLILQEGVDLIVSFCSISKLHEFTPLFENYKKPLIHVDLGGSFLKNESVGDYVLHHTLNLCQSAYAAGVYAAQTFGIKGYSAASFYDGGYQLTESFVRGFASEGGEMQGYFICPMDYKSETFQGLLDAIDEIQPDFVFSLFSYNEGKKVFDIWANSSLNGEIPMVTLPLMTDETINTTDLGVKNVFSVASWTFDDERPAMKNFIKTYYDSYESNPNIMGLLGYEVGLTIAQCITPQGSINAKLTEAMKGKSIETPRGRLSYNHMNESQVDSFLVRKFQFNQTKYHNHVAESLDASSTHDLYAEFEPLPFTGWQNPYICT